MQGRTLEINLHQYKLTTMSAANTGVYETTWR
jgi:hypothetical protein